MTDVDLDSAQESVIEQTRWGEGLRDRTLIRLVRWARRTTERVEAIEGRETQARDAIVALRARVKALEDRQPLP